MINQQRIQEWIKLYLDHIREITPEVHVNQEEGYKFKAVDNFQKSFDLEAKDLEAILNHAIESNNLVVGSWYFPKKMLTIFAKEAEQDTRSILKKLYDEKQPVSERIDTAQKAFDAMMEARNTRLNEKANHFMGLRFLSLLLAYRYPQTYDALKPNEWKSFCKFIDPDFKIQNGTTSGARYTIFSNYIDSLRSVIRNIPEIVSLHKQLTEGLHFKDDQFHWMTQDVIYVTSSLIAKGKLEDVGAEDVEDVSKAETLEEEGDRQSATTNDRFTYEEDLEQFIIDNIERGSLGAKLKLYSGKDGQSGQQFQTEFGTIDILTVDTDGNYIVIELKRDLVKEGVVGQIAKYMQWVEENLAKKDGKKVSGIVLAYRAHRNLVTALKALRFPVSVVSYKLNLNLKPVE